MITKLLTNLVGAKSKELGRVPSNEHETCGLVCGNSRELLSLMCFMRVNIEYSDGINIKRDFREHN